MSKKEILLKIKQHYDENKQKSIKAASKMYDYIESHKVHTIKIGDSNNQVYEINGKYAALKYYDYMTGIADFVPLYSQDNIGTKYNGGILRIDFNHE